MTHRNLPLSNFADPCRGARYVLNPRGRLGRVSAHQLTMTTPQAGQWDITKVKLSFPLLQAFCSTLPLLMPFDAIVRSDGLKRIVWKLLQNSLGEISGTLKILKAGRLLLHPLTTVSPSVFSVVGGKSEVTLVGCFAGRCS